jgi:hypothetical protein
MRNPPDPKKPKKSEAEYLIAYDIPADATARRTFYYRLDKLAGSISYFTRSVVLAYDEETKELVKDYIRAVGGRYVVFSVNRLEEWS